MPKKTTSTKTPADMLRAKVSNARRNVRDIHTLAAPNPLGFDHSPIIDRLRKQVFRAGRDPRHIGDILKSAMDTLARITDEGDTAADIIRSVLGQKSKGEFNGKMLWHHGNDHVAVNAKLSSEQLALVQALLVDAHEHAKAQATAKREAKLAEKQALAKAEGRPASKAA